MLFKVTRREYIRFLETQCVEHARLLCVGQLAEIRRIAIIGIVIRLRKPAPVNDGACTVRPGGIAIIDPLDEIFPLCLAIKIAGLGQCDIHGRIGISDFHRLHIDLFGQGRGHPFDHGDLNHPVCNAIISGNNLICFGFHRQYRRQNRAGSAC